MTQINFTASLIKNTDIIKRKQNKNEHCKVSFVELDKNCPEDMEALETISNKWPDSYAELIIEDITKDRSDSNDEIKNHVYALTSQLSEFDKLNSDKILGIIQFSEKPDKNKIEFIQTNPKYIKKDNPDTNYAGIGSAIINSLKEQHHDNPIEAFVVYTAMNFYSKNGFVHNDMYPLRDNALIWHS